MKNSLLGIICVVFLISCAVPQMERREAVEAPVTPEKQRKAQNELQVPLGAIN